jgi:hypothetical protein
MLTEQEAEAYEKLLSKWHREAAAKEEEEEYEKMTPWEKEEFVDRLEYEQSMDAWDERMSAPAKKVAAAAAYSFIQVGPCENAADTWFRAESIDRVMELVLGGLSPKDIGHAAQVCRRWREAAELDRPWEILTKRAYPTLALLKAVLPVGSWKAVTKGHVLAQLRLNAPRQPRLTDYLVGVEVRRKKATEGRWSLAASQNCSLAKTS